MKNKKFKTISYIFLHTVVLQFIVIGILLAVNAMAFFGLVQYSNGIIALLGAAAFIVMLLAFLAISIFTTNFGVSVFSKKHGEYNGADNTPPTYETHYSLGRKSTLTGEREIIATTKEKKGGPGKLIGAGFHALIIGLTGIFKFIIETMRVLFSDERQAAWENGRMRLNNQRASMGSKSFYSFQRKCAIWMAIILAISIPLMIFTAYQYHPDRLEFNITEKENSENNNLRIHVLFNGTLENHGFLKIKQVEGVLVVKNKTGEVLYENKLVIQNDLSDLSFLNDNDSLDVSLGVLSAGKDPGTNTIWDTPLEDLEISMRVSQIDYALDQYVDFMLGEPTIIIKELGK